jgi:S-DNA-T family DNA segregation ATPase FtsK/SpoIIIE
VSAPDQRPDLSIVRGTPGDTARGMGDEPDPGRVQRPGADGVIPNHPEQSGTVRNGAERLATETERAGALEVRGEGELLPDDDQELAEQQADDVREIQGRVVDRPGTSIALRVAGQVARLPRSERGIAVARVLAVHGLTVVQGGQSWAIRAYDGLTRGVYRRQIRAWEAAGDADRLAEWVDRRNAHANDRAKRLMDLPHIVLGAFKILLAVVVGIPFLLLVASFLVWATGAGEFATVWRGAGSVLRFLFGVADFAWTWLVPAIPFLLLVAAWREGRRRGIMPGWLVAEEEKSAGRDVIPDEGAILNALRHLGLAPLNKAFKDGWRPRFPLGTGRDGKGYRTQLELPQGVTVEMINQKKKLLAHNLVRLPIEVWPTEPKDQPGVLDLWVADQGFLTKPVGPWPLLAEGACDYFKGVPVAVDIRGTTVVGRLFEANYAVAGMMGSGKSTLIITALLGAITDPLVEVDVYVMAVNADYDPLRPRLRTLMTGTGDEVVEACMGTLRGAYNELDVRGRALQDHGERAVNRRLAEADPRLRPRVIVVDECQALFMHEEYGEEAEALAHKLMAAARKYAITLIFATPEASSASLPRRMMSIVSNKACFAIGDQTSNDAILGTGSYKAGITATSLEPKTADSLGDVGTCMARGFQGKPGLLRCYYVSQADAYAVVERAVALRERADVRTTTIEERDLLDDLAAVLGPEPMPSAKVPALLARHAPHWLPYRKLTGIALREQLAELGVHVPKTGNLWPLGRDAVVEAIAERAAREADGTVS